MRIKRVEAASVAEAMRELRRELGDRALILHTKNLPPRGLTGWFKTPRVEILGAVDEPELIAAASTAAPAASAVAPVPVTAAVATSPAPAEPPAAGNRPRKSRKAPKPAESDAPPRVAAGPVRLSDLVPAGHLAEMPAVPVASVEGIRLAIPDWAPAGGRARRIAFVGPTGAGKTTTLAKLAAKAQLEHGRRVGLVTIDTYRIGAVPQLRAYAEILNVPLEVAQTSEELSHALARLADRDLIFIDTIGRSPLGGGVDTLVPFIATAAADEVHLVLAATTRSQDSLRAARSFSRLAPNRLVITKLDETDDHEALTVVARATNLPLTWFGIGQEVPDDIEEATAARAGGLVNAGGLA